jgi:hypothetical protein
MSNEKRFVVKHGLQTDNIKFVSPDRNSSILAEMLDTATLGFTGSAGELLTIIDTQEGVLFSVNGANSEPLIEVESIGEVRLAEIGGRVLVGKSETTDFDTKLQVDGGISADDIAITGALSANGSIGTSGQVLVSDGTKTYWSTEVGFSGSQGGTGFTGSRGDTGFTGSQGSQGFTGSQGPVAGANTNIIYNDSGEAAGTNSLSWNDDTNTLIIQNNIRYVSADSNSEISTSMLDSGTLSFSGTSGQLFSITDTMEGTIFSVNDISGVPSIEVEDDGTIRLAELDGNVLIGTATDTGDKLQVNGTISANNVTISGALSANGSIGTSGQVLTSDGDKSYWSTSTGFTGSQGTIGFTGSQGFTGSAGADGASSQFIWQRKTANYTAVNQDGIIADTSGGSFTITLPANPDIGDYVVIVDGGKWEFNDLTVARNGSTIEGVADDLILDVSDTRVDFVYDGTTWQVFSNVGQRGFTGSQGVIGFTGSQGIQGFTGSQGIQGFTGSQGVIGFTGSQGIQGFTGSQGPTGNNTISISDDTTTDDSRYLIFTDQTSGTANGANVSSTKLFFNPLSGQLNATEFNALSDITLKNDLKRIEDPISIINNIDGFSFRWKETDVESLGVSAQQVETILPELVSNNNDMKTVNYNGLIAVLIEAVKELDRKIS